jgi:hypothetical protein
MVFLVFAVVVLTALAVVWLGPSWARRRDQDSFPGRDRPPTVPSSPFTVDAFTADSQAQFEEIRLVEHLLAGSLSIEQYRHRVTDLAVQDARHHPVIVPPDDGSCLS